MTRTKNAKILAFVGLAGSGKSSAVDYLTQKGYPKIYFGGIVYEKMKQAGIQPGDWEPERQFRENLRIKYGKEVVATFAAKEAHDLVDAGQHRIIFDGLYSWSEYKYLKHEFPGEITTIAIVTPKHIRYQRMSKRTERPMQPHEVDERDWKEIENMEKGGPIAIADYFVHNDRGIEHLYEQLDTIIDSVEF